MTFEGISSISNQETLVNYYEKDFNIEEKIKELKGPYIEIAGPTAKGYELIDVNNLDKKLYVSNLYDSSRRGQLDFRGDVKRLPIKDASVGALFVSNLGGSQSDSSSELKKLRGMLFSEKRDLVTNKEMEKYSQLSRDEQRQLKDEAIKEAFRVLENKGLLIWQGGDKGDVVAAERLGFVRKIIKNTLDRDMLNKSPQLLGSDYDCVFEKVLLEAIKEK